MAKQPAKPRPASKYQAFFEKPGVKLATGILAYAMAVAFASWAIDSGSLLDYAITLLLIASGTRELWDVARTRLRKREP